ncbi:MAG TPA: GGDEF domain-containing protein [Jatrophihabitans sp.]
MILIVDISVIAWVATVATTPVHQIDLVRFVVVAALGVVSFEVSRLLARQRFLFNESTPYTNLSSIWTLAGTLILPPNLVACLAILSHLYFSRRISSHVARTYRDVYSGAALTLSCLVAGQLLRVLNPHATHLRADLVGTVNIALTVSAYYLISLGLILGAILLAVGVAGWRNVVPSREQLALEATSVLLGAITAVLVVHQPWLVIALPPILVMLERASHTQHFQRAASLDTKTGLLNATAWQILATRELVSTAQHQESAAVLIVDLDHFKRINDSYGHLAGDRVLGDVAGTLNAELRGYDLIGRFGGEEFVAFLPGATAVEAVEIAERVRRGIHDIVIAAVQREGSTDVARVTASIGIAAYPEHGHELSTLLQEADLALYHAKEGGRDGVQTAMAIDDISPLSDDANAV